MRFIVYVIITVFFIISTPIYAAETPSQIVSGVSTASNPSITAQQRLALPVGALPKTQASVTNQVEKKASPIAGASKIHFKLNKVIIKGNTVFSTDELENIFKKD